MQDIIESRVEKRTKGVYVPIGGKKLLTFMDDFNMPAKDTFGSQPPLELMRLWLDYGFWYDREKQTQKYIKVSASDFRWQQNIEKVVSCDYVLMDDWVCFPGHVLVGWYGTSRWWQNGHFKKAPKSL